MSRPGDTIAAIATPPGRGAIAIIRMSGPEAARIASVLTGKAPVDRHVALCSFSDVDGTRIDPGLMLYFRGPRSFTGEDVVELHGHGGTLVSDAVLAAALERGARLAEPGEFSLRAFLNEKLDLAQAEAIADLIDSGSQAAARAALRSLEGVFSEQVQRLQAVLTELRVQIEAWLDFPDEDLKLEAIDELTGRFAAGLAGLEALTMAARQGAVLRVGLSVVIAGPPNAGKSSLMNRLAGYDAAIVTPIPGTTRDPLKEHISLDGLPINLVDTAGLRVSEDPVEVEGIRRSHAAVGRADRLLWVVDIEADLAATAAELCREFPDGPPVTILQNKVDLVAAESGLLEVAGLPVIRLSALTGAGLPLLIAHLKELVGYTGEDGGTIGARTRHVDALKRARAGIVAARGRFIDEMALELAAEELRTAQTALSEITGEVSSDDLLGEIFGSFCIGK
jgi:tRNA modification GTPase